MKHLLTYLLISLACVTYSQNFKVEKEHRVEPQQVPKKAQIEISANFPEQAVKWIKEQSDAGISFETKFRKDGHLFSIEFDESGSYQDTEIKVGFSELRDSIQQNLTAYFQTKYRKFKIHKIQLQFIQPIPEVLEYWNNPAESDLLPNFEIEYYGKTESKELWEREFDHQGNFISKRKIVTKPTDNLSY